jgi:hypothetical protein
VNSHKGKLLSPVNEKSGSTSAIKESALAAISMEAYKELDIEMEE